MISSATVPWSQQPISRATFVLGGMMHDDDGENAAMVYFVDFGIAARRLSIIREFSLSA